jgi:glycosyltransferase involved in cell wall biosynthesis
MKRAWKALPTGVRARAHRSARSVMDALTPTMVAMAWRKGQPACGPVTVAGLLSSSIGIGRGARLFTAGLRAQGMPTTAWDVSETLLVASDLALDPALGRFAPADADLGAGGVLVTHLNPPELTLWLQKTACRGLKGRRHIGYWAWELPTLPEAWRPAFAYVDEVWCPSSFTAEAVRTLAPADTPVRVVPHPVAMTPRPAPDRARFGLPEGACVALAAFDLKSTSARKNPLGAIAAYRRAAPRPDGRSLLVCKVAGAAQFPERLAEVTAAADGRPDIVFLQEALSETDMARLVGSVDVVLSLHRAEGFGLLAAEAIWAGKPVIATAWSGVMDFLDAESAILVPWTAQPVEDVQAMYAGGWWAEPDLHAAADGLARLMADRDARETLGARASAHAARLFDPLAWSTRVEGLLGRTTPA